MNDKGRKFYDALISEGKKLPKYEVFESTLQDRDKANKFYDALVNEGKKLPDFDTFYSTFQKKSEQQQEPIPQEEPIGTTQEGFSDTVTQPKAQTSVFGFNQGFTKPEVVEDPIEEADPEARSNLEDLSNSLYNTWQGIKTSFLDLSTGVQMPKYKIEKLAESGINSLQDRFDVSDEVADVTQSMFDMLSDGTMGMVSLGELGIGMINSNLKPEDTSESLASIAQKTSAIREKMRPVTPALESIRKGDAVGIATGAVNGALGYVPSILVGAATRGLGFIPMFAGSAFNEGVAEKARLNPEIQQELSQGLKKDLTDQEIREIIKSGEADVFVPALMGGVAGMLEKYGLGKAKKMLTEKILSNKGLNVVKDVLFEGGRQGFINWLEGGLMQYNVDYAKSGDLVESAVNMTDWLVSEEGANAAIEATLGTMLTGGVGAGARRFSRKEETQESAEKSEAVEKTPKFKEKTLKTEEDSYKFIGDGDEMVFETGGLTQEKANKAVEELSKKYPKVNFQVKDNTDKEDVYAEPNFTIISSPVKNQNAIIDPLKDVESTIEALKSVPTDNKTDSERAQSEPFWEAWHLVPYEFKDYIYGGDNSMQRMMATAYHSAKKDRSNPELIQAVESLFSKQTESPVYKQGEETLEREELQSRIEEAESVEDLEGIGIENDTELEGQLKSKMDEVSEKSKQELTESAQEAERVIPVKSEEEAEVGEFFTREIDGDITVYEKGEDVSRIVPPNEYDRIEGEETEQQPESEGRVVVEDVQQEQPSEATDTEVQVEDQISEKDSQKIKFEQKQKTIDTDKKLTDTKELQEGDYVAVKSDNGTVYEGFVTKKGRKNISVESSSMYGVSESQFRIENVEAFYKPKETNETAKETDNQELLEGVQETGDQDQVRKESEQLRKEEVEKATEKPIQSDVTIEDSRPRVTFSVFGEEMTGTRDGDVIIGDDGTRYQPSMVSNVKEIAPENRIEKQKEAVKKALKDVKDKFNEGNQNAIIYDFKKVAENDIKFYNSLRNLVVEYARLKGMQFEQAIKELETVLNQTIHKKSREYLKSMWDEVKSETPKRKLKDETIGLTQKEATKQGIEELLEDRRRKAQQKINQLRDESKKKIKEARDKGKEKLDSFKNIRQTMADFIKMDLKDIPADSFTKKEVNKIISQIEKAKTDYSLNKAIEQVYGVLGEAGQRKRLAKAKDTQKTARRNVKSGKIGISPKDGPIDNILRIDPKIVPRRIFEMFESVINQIGQRKSVLAPKEKNQLISDINEVMQSVEEQNIKVEELSALYEQADKVQGTRKEGGKTVKYDSFSKTVDQMLKDGVINDEDAAIMRDRRNEIVEYTRETETKTDEQLEEERQEAIIDAVDKVKKLPENNPLLTADEKSIYKFYKSLKKEDLERLSFEDVKRVNKLLDNLSNNFVPHLAEKIRQKVSGQRDAKPLIPILSNFRNSFSNLWNFVSRTKAGYKNWKRPGSTSIMQEKIRRNPTIYIDQVLNNFKNTALYDATFRKLGQAYESYNNELQKLQSKLSVAERKLKKPFESRAKLTFIRLQEQFQANDGQNTAKEWLDATLNDRNSIYDKVAKDELQRIFDQYVTDGEFDVSKAKKSMSKEESDAYNVLKEHFEYLSPKADFTATVIRGNRVPIFESYHPVYRAVRGFEDSMELDKLKRASNPSTKAGTLTDRTGRAHAISFDPFDTALLNAKEVLLDYNMTPQLSEINSAMDYLTSQAETDSQVEAVNSLRNVVNEMVENVIGVNFGMNNVADQIVNELVRKGYQATLGGIGRSMSELTSNTVFATMYKPNEFLNGVSLMMKNRGDISMLADVVNNSKSTQKTRLFDYGGMDSKHVDYSRNGNEMRKVLSPDSKTRQAIDKAGNYYRAVDRWAANVVSKPDQLVARPLWFGSYAQEFEAITGKKPDFKKIAENDSAYMEQYGEAIDKATNFADDVMTEAVASSNPFDGILKSQISPSKAWITNFANTFNSYMTRFAIFEYNSALRGINSLMGNGMLTKTEGAKLLVALNARLAIYGLFTDTVVSSIYRGIVSMLGYSLEDEEEKEGVENVLAKEMFSAIGMLAINRNLGNWAKIPTNFGMEYLNKEYGKDVTYKGDYDPYANNITYPLVPLDGSAYGNLSEKITTGLMGPIAPIARTGFNAINYATSAFTAAKPETRQRNLDKLIYKTTFELAGNLGFIPAYRDLRGVYNKIQYETKQNAVKASDGKLKDDFDTSKLNFD